MNTMDRPPTEEEMAIIRGLRAVHAGIHTSMLRLNRECAALRSELEVAQESGRELRARCESVMAEHRKLREEADNVRGE